MAERPPELTPDKAEVIRITPRRGRSVAIVLAVLAVEITLFAVLPRAGFGPLPLLLASSILVAFAIVVLGDRGASIGTELGTDGALAIPALLGVVMALPMAGALALVAPLPHADGFLHLVRTALAIALAEEIVFRGYALRALRLRAGMSAPLAGAITAIAFGLARAAATDASSVALLAEAFALGAVTGGWYAWVVAAWGGAIAPAIGLHFGVNLALLAFGERASTSLAAHAGRLACFVLSIVITLAWRRFGKTAAPAP